MNDNVIAIEPSVEAMIAQECRRLKLDEPTKKDVAAALGWFDKYAWCYGGQAVTAMFISYFAGAKKISEEAILVAAAMRGIKVSKAYGKWVVLIKKSERENGI